jgi:peptidoglycan/xylan/chitin deacetylase (PgdA/CDA1 family)
MTWKFGAALGPAVATLMALAAGATAAECPRKDALGTSRVLAVAVETALHGMAITTPATLFFRFPYFEMTPATLEILQKGGIALFGADLWAGDWNPMTPAQPLKLLTDRLKIARKGIILLHYQKAQTAAMLPAFLRYLRDNHHRVVHVVPADAKTVSGKAH